MSRLSRLIATLALLGAAASRAAETPRVVKATPASTPSATPAAAPSAAAAATGEPDKHEVLEALMHNASLKLSEGRYCAVELPDRPSPTLGDWMAKLLADMDAGENSIEIACDPPVAKAPDVWTCHADFVHAEGDDHWKFSLELGIKGSDKSLVKGTLACAGMR